MILYFPGRVRIPLSALLYRLDLHHLAMLAPPSLTLPISPHDRHSLTGHCLWRLETTAPPALIIEPIDLQELSSLLGGHDEPIETARQIVRNPFSRYPIIKFLDESTGWPEPLRYLRRCLTPPLHPDVLTGAIAGARHTIQRLYLSCRWPNKPPGEIDISLQA